MEKLILQKDRSAHTALYRCGGPVTSASFRSTCRNFRLWQVTPPSEAQMSSKVPRSGTPWKVITVRQVSQYSHSIPRRRASEGLFCHGAHVGRPTTLQQHVYYILSMTFVYRGREIPVWTLQPRSTPVCSITVHLTR